MPTQPSKSRPSLTLEKLLEIDNALQRIANLPMVDAAQRLFELRQEIASMVLAARQEIISAL